MILQNLRIDLVTYGEHKGEYRGSAKFSNESGEVTVVLLPEHCDAIFDLCSDAILLKSKEVARAMVSPILTQRALEKNELPPRGVLKNG